ncbi:male sterility C-terminal domain [gamma proteobacterium HTCC5015]|nr:male sterility C-terminal domain [gamma proteobacterium HTCC5015]
MAYFVTGATGFIGKRLVQKLLNEKRGTIYVLTRSGSKKKLNQLIKQWGGGDRIVPVTGDLSRNKLGVSAAKLKELKGNIKHFYHLAAIYDLSASAEAQETANIEGTRNAIQLAEAIEAGCFHHTSSIAAAGTYSGVFREDMFEEAEGLGHPYFRTKHDSEGIVRKECDIPWRVYRPGVVVGDSKTGEMDKIDGPYYLFKSLQKLRNNMPKWMPLVGLEGGTWNIVPVDFVVDAMTYISHQRGLNGQCFHLTEDNPRRIGEVINIFADAAHAPQMTMRINAKMFSFIPSYIVSGVAEIPPVQRFINAISNDLGIPADLLKFVNHPTRFDNRETRKILKGTGIKAPDIKDYAWRLWDYWERNMDPDLFIDRSLGGRISGKVVMVTGASSGIGEATALRLAEAGGKVVIVARNADKLKATAEKMKKVGGEAYIYTCDISDLDDCDRLAEQVNKDLGGIDILINNAGRSIRRSVALSFDRFHDYERTMQLNYFGCLRLTMGFLPKMIEKRGGHVINISSIGVLSYSPRFSAYVASKAALDAFSQCAASEFSSDNIRFTTINMPLVRTPMIAPTKMYNHVPTYTPEEAADLVAEAIIKRPKRIATRLGTTASVMHSLAPKLTEVVLNTAFTLFPDSAAARGEKSDKAAAVSAEQMAFAQLTRGIHW